MKCQKCGMNEVTFHYSSNVNGCVTEKHLCSKCAAESGYDIGQMFDMGQLAELGNFLDTMLLIQSGFVPLAIPKMQSGAMLPYTTRHQAGMIGRTDNCGCGCAKPSNVEVDEEMSLRRELNAQMRVAVANEEFEKAAELRDKIRQLEANKASVTGRSVTCDSETTSQDSPGAQ